MLMVNLCAFAMVAVRESLPTKERKSSVPLFVYHFMFHQSLLTMCMIAFHFKLQLFYKESKMKAW